MSTDLRVFVFCAISLFFVDVARVWFAIGKLRMDGVAMLLRGILVLWGLALLSGAQP